MARAFLPVASRGGRSQWLGSSRALSRAITQAMKQVLLTGASGCTLSKCAIPLLEATRDKFDFLVEGKTALQIHADGSSTWWTFAGGAANALLRRRLHGKFTWSRFDDLSIELGSGEPEPIDEAEFVATDEMDELEVRFSSELKFGSCLPQAPLLQTIRSRIYDADGTALALHEPRVIVRTLDDE